MLISIWMIVKRIVNCTYEADIHSGSLMMDTFHISVPNEYEEKSDLMREHCLMVYAQPDGVRIRAGEDSAFMRCSLENAVNELIGIFNFYGSWERRLLTAINAKADLKETLEIFNEVCPYPIAFMELDGSVIASSDRFTEYEVNDNWYMIKTSRQVPMRNQARSWYNETLDHQFVDDTPQYLNNGDGEMYIGMYFSRDKHRIMGMIIIEYGGRFTPDVYQLCEILHSRIGQSNIFDTKNERIRTRSSIMYDLLEGNKVDTVEMDRFYENESFIFPWNIVVIRKMHYGGSSYVEFLIDAFKKNIRVKTVMLQYADILVVLVQQKKLDIFLEELGKILDMNNYQIGISMAFHSLQQIPMRYKQACFALNASDEPGVRSCEKYALDYIIQSIKRNVYDMEMLHPALEILRKADARKNSQLYDTLNVYLHHDRSINAAAEAMYVHRNSMLYRINRIKELTDVNLDDPMECEYLRISYLVEQSEHRKLQ